MSIRLALKRLLLNDLFSVQESKLDNLSTVTPDSNALTEDLPGIVHGTVSVQGGTVIVTDPENEGSYATLVIPDNPMVQVFVNGERVEREVVLSQSHSLDIQLATGEPSRSYGAIVSSDELSVTVHATVVKGMKLSLRDHPPTRRLDLSIEETYTDPNPASPEVILKLLSQNGVNGTIDYPAVNRLCNASGTQEEVVLRGIAPQRGKSARLRPSVNFSSERDLVLETTRLPKLAIGTTFAVLEPERTAVPGKNVYGAAILPQQSQPRVPAFGNGVISVNGNIVAAQDGRLVYQKGMMDIVPELVLRTDVSSNDGEIQFQGNLIIHGSIRNKAIVKASGTITVYGAIESSSVYGRHGVFVRDGIYKSNVVAGDQQIASENLLSLLDKVLPELQRFYDEYSLMVVHAMKRFDAKSTIPKIPLILFEKRHENLSRMLDVLIEEYLNGLSLLDKSYSLIKEVVETTWAGDARFKISQQDSEWLLDKLSLLKQHIQSLPRQLPVVRAMDVTTSTIRSAGNILIKGTCYASTLESGHTVSVQKSLQGGFTVAKKSAYISELGNPSGLETSVRVDNPSGFIRITLNHINTLIDVDGRRLRTYDTERDIRFEGVLA